VSLQHGLNSFYPNFLNETNRSAPPSLFAPTGFVFCKAKCAARFLALAPPAQCAGKLAELLLIKILEFDNIVVERENYLDYILYTIMLYNNYVCVK
jgi:hypothetical protein